MELSARQHWDPATLDLAAGRAVFERLDTAERRRLALHLRRLRSARLLPAA
ncbi:MAG: hypothetical protein ACR2NA_08130 [Solirubrobacterales bacterium]